MRHGSTGTTGLLRPDASARRRPPSPCGAPAGSPGPARWAASSLKPRAAYELAGSQRRKSNHHKSIIGSPPDRESIDNQTAPKRFHPFQSGCRKAFCFATKTDELEVAFEQLVNEIDNNCEHSQSAQEPHGFPEESDNYDCKNQQKQILNTSLDSHALMKIIFQ
jgi:hypothetical protein